MTTSHEGIVEPSDPSAMLMEALIRAEVDDIDRPHIVVCTAVSDGAISFFGPFATGLEALAMAHQEFHTEMLAGSDRFRFSVAPLCGPAHDEDPDDV